MSERKISGAAIGWISFAGFMLILAGCFKILAGLAAVINPENFPNGKDTQDLLFSGSVESWGWWTLIIGVIVLLAGFGVFTGNVLARTIGVLAALGSAISMFVWMPIYPVWAIIIIIVDVSVIWALTAHGRDIQRAEQAEY